MLINKSIEIIFKLSFKSLFLSKTINPNPPLDNNPAMATPKDICPLINIMVKAIETAQLGIKPIIADIAHNNTLFACLNKIFAKERCSRR